jgi:hypothetical protein
MIGKKFIVLTIFLVFISFAHSEEVHTTPEQDIGHFLETSFLDAAIYGTLVILVIMILSVKLKKNISRRMKKVIFVVISLIVLGITLYLAGGTIYLNLISESGGPVHWHADFEVYVCGEKQTLPTAYEWCTVTTDSPLCGFTNKVGTEVFHHHDDLRIHIEGVVVELDNINVGSFFEIAGGEFTETMLTLPQSDGSMKTWMNGDLCADGSAGKLKFLVNGEPNEDFDRYIIKPFSTVPPGDVLEIRFE